MGWLEQMSAIDPIFLFLVGLATLAIGTVGTTVLVRIVRSRQRAKRRVVERPNSHYTSQLAAGAEAKHRWHGIALDRIHEINRAEVVRLLAKLEATSVDALNARERAFLDGMAELTGAKPRAEDGGEGKPMTGNLRHRPA
jgi:hypothetical protein